MKFKRRKIRPAVPGYAYYNELDSSCWRCKNKNNCGGCKTAKRMVAAQKRKI